MAHIHERGLAGELLRGMDPFDPIDPFDAVTTPGRRTFRLLLFLLILVLGFYLGLSWRSPSRPNSRLPDSKLPDSELPGRELAVAAGPAAPRPVAERADLTPEERRSIELFRNASPAVVFITTLEERVDYFNRNILQIPRGTGSGFVWDREGHVVTNYHVISDPRGRPMRARVTLADRSSWEAEVIGGALEKDLAVLKVAAPRDQLVPIQIGRSGDLLVGQSVYAIGNPFGLDQTLTTGVISALGREIESLVRAPIPDVIQTDAAINPGNSGGPLLDSSGRLIGVNTQIYSPSGGSAGIGFAIPVDTVNWVVADLIAYGEIRRPQLGIEMAPDAWLARSGFEGVLILEAQPGGGAERAGLRGTRRTRDGRIELGDIIVAVEGEPVRSQGDLMLLLERYEAGNEVELTVLRGDERKSVRVRLSTPR